MANLLVTTVSESGEKNTNLMKELNDKHKLFVAQQNQRLVTDNLDAVKWFCGKVTSMLTSSRCRDAYLNLYAETGKMDSVPNECKTGEILDAPSEKTFSYDWQHVKRTIEKKLPGVSMYSGSMYADGPSFEISPNAFTFSKEELEFARNNWLEKDNKAQIEGVKEIIPKLDVLVEKLDPVSCAEAHKQWFIEHGYFTDVLADCTTSYVKSPYKNMTERRLRESWKKDGFGIQGMDGEFRAFMTKDEAFKHI